MILRTLAVLLLVSTPLSAATLSIRVTAADDTGKPNPVAGARVALATADEPVFAEVLLGSSPHVTGSDGRISIPLPEGRFVVLAGIALRGIASVALPPGAESVELTLPEEGVLTGIVLDPDGKPVPAAEVLVTEERPEDTKGFLEPGRVVFRELSDGAGRFTVYRLPAAARYRARARGKELAPSVLRDLELGWEPVHVTLQRGAAVRGTVIAVPGGAPVVGAEVKVGGAIGITNEEGLFDVRGIPAGAHRLSVVSAGHVHFEPADLHLASGTAREGLTIRVLGLGRLTGRVLSPSTRPAAGAEIYLRYPADPELKERLPPDRTILAGVADDEGRFDLDGLLPAQGVDLIARHPGFAPTVHLGYSIVAGSTFETVILLRDGGTISGRVLADNGREGISGARVLVLPEGASTAALTAGEESPDPTARETVTGEDGSYTISQVPAGRKTIFVTSPMSVAAMLTGVEVANRSHRKNLNIFVGEGSHVAGIVRDPEGAPVAGAAVRLVPEIGPDWEAVCDRTGAFRITGIPAGPYSLTLRADGFTVLTREVEAPVEDLEIPLARGSGLTGRVLLSSSSIPAGPSVVRALLREPPSPLEPDRPVYRQVASVRTATGEFRVEDLAPGAYRIEAWTEGGHYGALDGILVAADSSAAPVSVRVFGGWTISGRIVSSRDGLPIEGASVAIRGISDDPGPHLATTDAAGIYSIEGVPAGFHTILVTARGFAPALIPSVEVREAGTARLEDIVLSEGVEVAGLLIGTDGTPRRGAAISLSSAALGGSRRVFTDDQGRFEFPNVAAGSWLLETVDDRMAAEGSRVQRLITVPEDEDVFVTIGSGDGTALTGRISSAGLPVAHALVTALALEGDLVEERTVRTTRTDADGNYLFSDVPPGDLLLSISVHGSPIRLALRVDPGPVVVKDLVLPDAGIEGMVEDLDDGVPVPAVRLVLVREASGSFGTFLARLTRELGEVLSDEEGTFRFLALPAGEYRIEAFRPGYGQATVPGIIVRRGGLTPVRLRMPQAGTLHGRVLDDLGSPIGNARVAFRDLEGRSATAEPWAEVDSDGRFSVSSLRTGTYTVEVVAPGHARAVRNDVQVFRGETPEVEFRLPREGRLRITVYGAGGRSLEGARVTIVDFWGRSIPFPPPTVGLLTPFKDPSLTDESGEILVSHLPPGIYTVTASLPGLVGSPTRVRLLEGELGRGAIVLLPRER